MYCFSFLGGCAAFVDEFFLVFFSCSFSIDDFCYVFMVELERGFLGLGMGLIDGMVSGIVVFCRFSVFFVIKDRFIVAWSSGRNVGRFIEGLVLGFLGGNFRII